MAADRSAIMLTPLLVDAVGAAALLSISVAHFRRLAREGRIGPEPVRLGKCIRWSRAELARWADADCPPRHLWQQAARAG